MLVRKVAVLGAGSWGTALAQHLASNTELEVVIWGRNEKVLESIAVSRFNNRYFPDFSLHPDLKPEKSLEKALNGADIVVLSVPSSGIRETLKAARPYLSPTTILLNTAKGLEKLSLKCPSEVMAEECPENTQLIASLSGPSFAKELLENQPTAVVIASKNQKLAENLVGIFNCGFLRVYSSSDLKGLELGGAFKNVIALAVGISDGSGYGLNARAALITRGLAEMSRLIVSMGGKPETVSGLSVLGDLFLTCTGDLSRNRQVGLRLGRGERIPEILSDLGQVSEGVNAAPRILDLAKSKGIDLPITTLVVQVLREEKTVEQGVKELFARGSRAE